MRGLPSKFATGNFALAFIIFAISGTLLYIQRFNLETLIRANLNGPLSFMQGWRLTEWLAQYAWGPLSFGLGWFSYWFRNNRRYGSSTIQEQINDLKANQLEFRTMLDDLDTNVKTIEGLASKLQGYKLSKEEKARTAVESWDTEP